MYIAPGPTVSIVNGRFKDRFSLHLCLSSTTDDDNHPLACSVSLFGREGTQYNADCVSLNACSQLLSVMINIVFPNNVPVLFAKVSVYSLCFLIAM